MKSSALLSLVILFGTASLGQAFAPDPIQARLSYQSISSAVTSSRTDDMELGSTASSRRAFFQILSASSLLVKPLLFPQSVVAAESTKILVLGGTGFVGSQVMSTLRDMGIETIATSRDGRDGTIALDLTSENVQDQIQKLSQGCAAVISCVGAIGTADDKAVNSGTGLAASAAKAAGVSRFVYITVAPEVKEFARDIDFLKGYMEGKSFSRETVLAAFDGKATLIEPTFIYGGGSFELNPPRVASFYGQFIEGLLSSSPIRTVERVLSPGIIKIALEPPVPVEAVAQAAVAGALGKTDSILDSYDKIKSASRTL
jgi:hypothetical protein